MSASEERSRVAAEKKTFARGLLQKGWNTSRVHKSVKKRFGSGIASRDVIEIRRELEATAPAFVATRVITAPNRPRPSAYTARLTPAAEAGLKIGAPPIDPSKMRRFVLKNGDEVVAEGVQFSNRKMVLEANSHHNITFEWLDP